MPVKQKRLVRYEDEAFPSINSGRRLRGTTSISRTCLRDTLWLTCSSACAITGAPVPFY